MCVYSCPFSDNSKVIDLVRVYKVYKIFPKHSNGDYVWCFVGKIPSPPQAKHTKDALYSTCGWDKRNKYFTSFKSVKSEFLLKNNLKVYQAEVNFYVSILVLFALSYQKSMRNNYHAKFLYFCLLSFSRNDILYQTLSTLSAKAFKSQSVGHLIPGLMG